MTSASSSRGSSTSTPSRTSRPAERAGSASSAMTAPARASHSARSGKRASGKRRFGLGRLEPLVRLADLVHRSGVQLDALAVLQKPLSAQRARVEAAPLLDGAQREAQVVDLPVAAPEDPRAAVRRPERRAGPVALVHRHVEPVLDERARGAQADDPGPDDGRAVRQPAPPFGPARPSGPARSRCRSRPRARRPRRAAGWSASRSGPRAARGCAGRAGCRWPRTRRRRLQGLTVRAENPQRGKSGVPFMKSITWFCEIAFWISSRIWSSVTIMAPPFLICSAWIVPSSSRCWTGA